MTLGAPKPDLLFTSFIGSDTTWKRDPGLGTTGLSDEATLALPLSLGQALLESAACLWVQVRA